MKNSKRDEDGEDLVEMIEVLGFGFDGSSESQQGILDTIICTIAGSFRDEDECESIIHAVNLLAKKGAVDGRDVITQLVVPLSQAMDDPEILRNTIDYIADSLIEYDRYDREQGVIKSLDIPTFEALAVMFKKLLRSQDRTPKTKKSHVEFVVESVGKLVGQLTQYPSEDRKVIGMITSFTQQSPRVIAQVDYKYN